MKCLVCEGKYDLIFLQEYIEKYSKVQGYPVNNNMDDFFDIFRSDYHPFHEGYKCVIYGEGGKKLFERVIIPCVQKYLEERVNIISLLLQMRMVQTRITFAVYITRQLQKIFVLERLQDIHVDVEMATLVTSFILLTMNDTNV